MDRVDTIMERLGFNKEACDDTKAAFLKNLIKQAYGVEESVPLNYKIKSNEQQLSFSFEETTKVG